MKNRVLSLLLSGLLIAAFFCTPVLAQEEQEPPQTETISEETIPEEVEIETEPEQALSEEIGEKTEPEEILSEEAEGETEPEEVLSEGTGEETAQEAAYFITAVLSEPEPITVITIAAVKALPPGAEGVSFRGTVVLVNETDMVVQDDSGGIRLAAEPEILVGDILLVTGNVGESFCATEVSKEGSGELPAVETRLISAPEALRIVVKDGTLTDGILTQGECSIEVRADAIPEGAAEVYGVILDGIMYADSIVPLAPPAEPADKQEREWNVYFGLLDAHTEISDGTGTVQQAFSYAAGVEGLDFFAVTDHSDSFDNAQSGSITVDGSTVSAEWALGKQATAAVTSEHFVGIFGYEMTWAEDKALGHINTFNTPGWQTRDQSGFGTLEGYFEALRQVPGAVSQFNHPGLAYGDFLGFRQYDPVYDAVMQMLQVEGENGSSYYSYYIRALDAGWHVAPTVGQDNHHGDWGSAGSSRTAVLSHALTEENLYEAMGSCRVYATQDSDLYVDFRLNGHMMGSVIGVTDALEVSAVLDDPTDAAIGTVAVISTGGQVLVSRQLEEASGELTFSVPSGYPYYFLRITQPDGDVAVTAPVWVDDFTDMGIADFSADVDSPLAGQAVNLTLALFNHETEPFLVNSVVLMRDGQKLGDFTADGTLRFTYPLLWEEPGQLQLTAVVRGTVDGKDRSYQKTLTLHYRSAEILSASIGQARSGSIGKVYEVSGYATSGNTNVYTTFPDTIYVQDDTGGIPAVGEFTQSIQVGTPLQITGVLRDQAGERYLDLIDCQVLDTTMYRYVPVTLGCGEAMDYAQRGGSLLQTEGTVTKLTLTSDGQGVERFTIQNSQGDTAEIVIEPEIRSGAYGVNLLASEVAVGKTVRAIGLLSREESGNAFLRVRNCDEVVYVPPIPERGIPDPTNPRTGDGWLWHLLPDFLRELG